MRFACLGSGSEGNGLVVEAGSTRVLMDCGFGLADSIARLARLDLQASDLAGIVVTHEHSDHIGGVGRLARRHKLPVWLTAGTLAMAQDLDGVAVQVIDSHAAFAVDGLEIRPFPVPHDAREPVQYVIDDGRRRLGVLTDLGQGTPHVVQAFSRLDALVLECNHDAQMLADNPRYPAVLKQRIAGPWGHLDNLEAARILAAIDASRLRSVVAAHLSRHNNRPELARQALVSADRLDPALIRVADQDRGIDWIAV